MKVICISTAKWPNNRNLTLGKWYEVLDVEFYLDAKSKVYAYKIIDDGGMNMSYHSRLFKNVEEVREEKLNQLLQ